MRRRRNCVEGLTLNDGSWCTNKEILKVEAQQYVRSLFAPSTFTISQSLDLDSFVSSPPEGAEALLAPILRRRSSLLFVP